LGTTPAEAMSGVSFSEASTFSKLGQDTLDHVVCHWSLGLWDTIWREVWEHEIVWCQSVAKAAFQE
jgi:hypothetical protein